MPGVHQVPGQCAAATADLHHEPSALPHRLEQPQDARCTDIGVKPEPEMVDQREVTSVVGTLHNHPYRRPQASAAPFRLAGTRSSHESTPMSMKVVAAQITPVFHDRARCVAKACDTVREAARQGAALVAFPETFIPGYPYWAMLRPPTEINPLIQELHREAVQL